VVQGACVFWVDVPLVRLDRLEQDQRPIDPSSSDMSAASMQ
jgi:hypothetical protein